ncbi:hypothetical protein U8326_14270 [Tsuneonella sp. CC-YZS046]|uniref:hypothetical protein n=1 Tax=Tsuneonella sp. CC-YZS046 TaxID=3042152 RepID=UPI002D7A02D2|nr:hypothetical protein [Tsuneonella sp. CC-YZS046]WRO66190.1 hypothetical protein U8326_14270 [Tsuneonella sp. CC-YZS046]
MTLIDPPQGNAPFACLCEKGPRRERLSKAFTATDCSRPYLCETPYSRPHNRGCPTRVFLSGIFLLAVSSGCSPETEAEKTSRASRLVGTHIFTCEGGRKVSVEFVGDGLTINLATLPDGKAERLTAPAAGVTYFGDYANLAISDNAIVILRAEAPSQICRRDSSERVGQPPP